MSSLDEYQLSLDILDMSAHYSTFVPPPPPQFFLPDPGYANFFQPQPTLHPLDNSHPIPMEYAPSMHQQGNPLGAPQNNALLGDMPFGAMPDSFHQGWHQFEGISSNASNEGRYVPGVMQGARPGSGRCGDVQMEFQAEFSARNAYSPISALNAYTATGSTQLALREENPKSANADCSNIIQESGQPAMPSLGVVSLEQFEMMASSKLPSSSSFHSSTQSTEQTKPEGTGSEEDPESTPPPNIPCSYAGCDVTFGRHNDRRRHEGDIHHPMRWYCPGMDAPSTRRENPCRCPRSGYSRKDTLLRHLKRSLKAKGGRVPCHAYAMAYGWHWKSKGSVSALKGYRPLRLRV